MLYFEDLTSAKTETCNCGVHIFVPYECIYQHVLTASMSVPKIFIQSKITIVLCRQHLKNFPIYHQFYNIYRNFYV